MPLVLGMLKSEFREYVRRWVEKDRCTALRTFGLIEAVMRDPFGGVGRPEPLEYSGAGV